MFPWLNDALGGVRVLRELRRETLASVSGRVVEIGFGSGANLPYYPVTVTSVTGLEPNNGMTDRARRRTQTSPIAVELRQGVAEDLPFADSLFDAAVTTLTLCSVFDPQRALRELHRVVRAEGSLYVIEHGLAMDPGVARWQQRLNGVERIVACGCNLNRPVVDLVTEAGFRFETVRAFFAPGVPRTHGWFTAGRAIRIR
ncbi:MAG: class I SAM-dependent methyltransferase [Vicinamibacterales bacterium]